MTKQKKQKNEVVVPDDFEPFIVKVQVSMVDYDGAKKQHTGRTKVLVYNEDKSFLVTLDSSVCQQVVDNMNGMLKAFFWAGVLDDGTLVVGEPAEWQEW